MSYDATSTAPPLPAASPPLQGGEKAHALAFTPSPSQGEGWDGVAVVGYVYCPITPTAPPLPAASPPLQGGEKAHALAFAPSPSQGEGWDGVAVVHMTST
jgi:hypothetical protein